MMIGIKQLFELCQLPGNKESKIRKICSYFKDKQVKWRYFNDVIEAELLDDVYDYYSSAGSLIVLKENYVPYSKQERLLFNKENKQAALRKIVLAINMIENEERAVFVERYLFDKPINKIMDKHYLSQYGYYKLMEKAKKQFCELLRIK